MRALAMEARHTMHTAAKLLLGLEPRNVAGRVRSRSGLGTLRGLGRVRYWRTGLGAYTRIRPRNV